MTRYAKYGRLDDPMREEGDVSFIGLASRPSPNRLNIGEVAEAKNVRMEDTAVTTREGYARKLDLRGGMLTDELSNILVTENGDRIEVDDPTIGDFYATTFFPGVGLSDKNQIAMVRESDVLFWNGYESFTKKFETKFLFDPILPISLDFTLGTNSSDKDFTVGKDIEPVQFNDQFILLSGRGPTLPVSLDFSLRQAVQKWDGSADTDFVEDPNIPNGSFGVVTGNRLAIVTGADIIEFSDIINESNYDVFGKFYIGAGDGDDITGIAPIPESSCVVFKRRSIWAINGLNTIESASVFQVSGSTGCVSRHSIQSVGSAFIFLGDAGVYMLDIGLDASAGRSVLTRFDVQNQPLSNAINDQILGENFNQAEVTCRSAFYRNRYYLSFSSDDTSRVYIYNTIMGAWESRDEYDFRISDFVTAKTKADTEERLYVANQIGVLYRLDDGDTDDGTSISWGIKTRAYDNDNLEIKNYRRGYVKAESLDDSGTTNLTVEIKEPDGDYVVPLNVPTETTGENTKTGYIERFSISRRGNSLQYNFTGTGRSKIKHCRAEFVENNNNLIRTYK